MSRSITRDFGCWFAGSVASDEPADFAINPGPSKSKKKKTNKKKTEKEFGSSRIKPFVQELSVTIARKRGNVERGEAERLSAWLDGNDRVDAYCFGVERGGTVFQKHIQMVIRVTTTSPKMFKSHLRSAMGWNGEQDRSGVSICVRTLKYEKVHTWVGMLGYCTKDDGEEGFALFVH